MKKLNIGIDIDDTITNTFEYLQPYVADFFNLDLEYLKENDILYTTIPKNIAKSEIEFGCKYYEKIAPNTPIKEDVVFYLNKLKEAGHKLIFITARNNTFYKDAYATSIAYLNKHKVPYDKLICSIDKVTVCKENNIDIFIDDSINNCTKVNDAGIEVILFSCKSNKSFNGFNKLNNWEEIYNYIQDKKFN